MVIQQQPIPQYSWYILLHRATIDLIKKKQHNSVEHNTLQLEKNPFKSMLIANKTKMLTNNAIQVLR